MMKSMKKPISKITDAIGVAVADEEFHCRGEFKMFHKGRPDEKDIENVKAFAKAIVSGKQK